MHDSIWQLTYLIERELAWDIDEASQTFLGPFTRGSDQMNF